MAYNTKQRELILDYVKDNSNCFTIDDVYTYLKLKNTLVGKVTIYRFLDKLNNEGLVNKYISEKGSKMTYRYNGNNKECHDHIHMRCTNCNEFVHVDCNEIETHIRKIHKFKMDNSKTIIYGICEKCSKSKE